MLSFIIIKDWSNFSSALNPTNSKTWTNVLEKDPKWNEFFGIFTLILVFFLSKIAHYMDYLLLKFHLSQALTILAICSFSSL